jgi:hypothetical protein
MNNYECVYNVGLLDDLHNYFPAFLYDSGRFQTPVQVFHYMRTEMNTRFNLPAQGARLAGFAPQTFRREQQAPMPVQTPPTARRSESAALAAVVAGLLDLSGNFLNDGSYFYMQPVAQVAQAAQAAQAAFLDPVIVRPSADVLARNTTLLQGSELEEESSCAICQDSISADDACRKLTACSHVYHQTCIDQWFRTNINCPTCRHDIRQDIRQE